MHETYDHWSVAVLTVTVHSSFAPTFDFFKKYVAFCTGFNLLTLIFMLPYIIMDLLIFVVLILHETYDHWSVAVLTVTVHSSFAPTFDFFKKYVAFCTGFNLLTLIFMLPYIIMDLLIFVELCRLGSFAF